jgi:hypothetical protein
MGAGDSLDGGAVHDDGADQIEPIFIAPLRDRSLDGTPITGALERPGSKIERPGQLPATIQVFERAPQRCDDMRAATIPQRLPEKRARGDRVSDRLVTVRR